MHSHPLYCRQCQLVQEFLSQNLKVSIEGDRPAKLKVRNKSNPNQIEKFEINSHLKTLLDCGYLWAIHETGKVTYYKPKCGLYHQHRLGITL